MKLKYINKRLKTGWRCVFGNGGQKLHNYAKNRYRNKVFWSCTIYVVIYVMYDLCYYKYKYIYIYIYIYKQVRYKYI